MRNEELVESSLDSTDLTQLQYIAITAHVD